MNVSYKDYSTVDVAKILGVDKTTVAGWCRNNIINYQNLSDGTTRARYLIPETEVEYLRKLFKKHGKRKAMQNYNKDWDKKTPKRSTPAPVIFPAEAFFGIPEEEETTSEVACTLDPESTPTPTPIKKPEFDEDRLLNAVLHIREVKEEIENCQARLNQLQNEYTELKQDIMDWI